MLRSADGRRAARGQLASGPGDQRSQRRAARRAQLVRSRTRSKNEIHAVLIRNLKGKPPMSDLFGNAGRATGSPTSSSPIDGRDAVNAALRHMDFLTGEIDPLDGSIATDASPNRPTSGD